MITVTQFASLASVHSLLYIPGAHLQPAIKALSLKYIPVDTNREREPSIAIDRLPRKLQSFPI